MSYLPRAAIRVALIIVSQVARVIEARVASGALSGNDIARAMATTFRSLQGHLAAAGTTYRDVLQPNVSGTNGRTPSAQLIDPVPRAFPAGSTHTRSATP